jgi:hypothetical protein
VLDNAKVKFWHALKKDKYDNTEDVRGYRQRRREY